MYLFIQLFIVNIFKNTQYPNYINGGPGTQAVRTCSIGQFDLNF